MIKIDGSYGEGGGQILRTSLALSLVTGKAFAIENIRAGRKKPGLMRQHLTAVNAAVEIGSAEITGNQIGSQSFTFRPGRIKTGQFNYAIGSAGSCTLVLQTVLPGLICANGPSELVLEGGTHNPFAPPYDFLEKSFLPILKKMGVHVTTELIRPGFYPAGGGKLTVTIQPYAFMSCSHGAGRVMGRKQASRILSSKDCDERMRGIVYDRWHKIRRGKDKGCPDLGEAPQAYKDIDAVIAAELDLIKPMVKLKPLAVVKG